MRYELTDYEWSAIKPFLPNKPRGVPRVNDRRVLNGIFWVLQSICFPPCVLEADKTADRIEVGFVSSEGPKVRDLAIPRAKPSTAIINVRIACRSRCPKGIKCFALSDTLPLNSSTARAGAAIVPPRQ